jgi:Spy/CpxP family protein refolding chaperone
MKRVIFSAALSVAMAIGSAPVFAQSATTDQGTQTTTNAPQRGMRGHRAHGDHMQLMAKKLNLTQQQQDQLKPIMQQSRDQAKAIKNDTTLSADQKKEKLQALHQQTKSQVNGILTPEQQQQMAQMKSFREGKMEGRRGAMGKMMAQKLNLSQQQQDQLKPIMQKQREQAKAIWQDNSLTQEQKQQKMQALHQDSQTQINAVLTPEQQQQRQQMRDNFKQHRHNRGGSPDQQPQPQGA